MLMLWTKGFETVPDKMNLKRQTTSQMQSVFLDLILYWMGRNTIKDIIRIIDRIGIWTDTSTLPILNFPEFDNSSVYVNMFFLKKSHWSIKRKSMYEPTLKWFGKTHNVRVGGRMLKHGSKMLKVGVSK